VQHENVGWLKTSQVNRNDGVLAPYRSAAPRIHGRPHGRLDRPRLEAYAGGGPLRPRAVYTSPPAIIDPRCRGGLLPIRDLRSQREA
jgi:hypothetical protein